MKTIPSPSKAHWITGLAATSSLAQAATVQFTLSNNQISLTGLASSSNTLSASVTPDAFNDSLSFTGVNANPGNVPSLSATINGVTAFLSYTASTGGSTYFARLGNQNQFDSDPISLFQLIPITFTDASINGGSATSGFVEVNARNINAAEHAIILTRLVFDDSSTVAPVDAIPGGSNPEFNPVPEPSGLALLALGLVGVTHRRQRKHDA